MKIRRLIYFIFIFLALVSGGCLFAQERDTARNGEGMYAFLRRHNREGEAYSKEFLKLNKGKLGKNNTLILGVKYILPPLAEGQAATTTPSQTTTTPPAENKPATTNKVEAKPANTQSSGKGKKIKEPLFGSKEAEFEITSDDLKGATFYVVCGHGGPDPGAVGKLGGHVLHEDEYAYDISLRLAKSLMTRGANVHIIIQDKNDGIRDDRYLKNSKTETCMGDPIPLKQFARLNQRCDKINALEKKNRPAYSRAIFIHIDSRSVHKRMDVFFYHSQTEASKKLAQTMRKTFSDKYRQHQPSRGFTGTVEQRNLYVINQTVPVALFVELGNIQNTYDQQRFILSNNRQALANWLCEGFARDYTEYRK